MLMELFKLFGKIAVDNTEAKKAIDDTTKKAKDGSKEQSSAFEKIGNVASQHIALLADNAKEMKYNITSGEDGKLKVSKIFNNQISIISFQNDILADKFLKSFGGLLESARKII